MKGAAFGTVIFLLIVVVAVITYVQFDVSPEAAQMKVFSSVDDLKAHIKQSSDYGYMYGGFAGGLGVRTLAEGASVPQAAATESESTDYSTTNIQAAGVDEADFVKNDGKYIYTISNNKVIILDAFPAQDMRVLSRISVENGTPSQIYVNNDRLVVFSSANMYGILPEAEAAEIAQDNASANVVTSVSPPYYRRTLPKTTVDIYDVSDRANPLLVRALEFDGYYYNSRMIGDYVYLISNQPIYNIDDLVVPESAYRCLGGVRCFNVYYFDAPYESNQFTIVSAINTQIDEEPNSKVFLMSYAQNTYVSAGNIYITYSKSVSPSEFLDKFVTKIVPLIADGAVKQNIIEIMSSSVFSKSEKMTAVGRVVQGYMSTFSPQDALDFQYRLEEKMAEFREEIAKEMERTVIHKLSIDGKNVEQTASGEVPGNTLNQFSMDESGGYFRIATTTDNWRITSKNHVYVLDGSLNTVGKLEDLAPGERIYSVRFIGIRAFMVTFRQIDPLFVIDLANPNAPQVLGFLKIPGVSDYLHPYDENHVIGVGRDASDEGRMRGLKLSLFDVTNPETPTEISNYIIGERGTYSEALNDHKAFLFSRERSLLAIPITMYDYRILEDGQSASDSWAGAYVFNLDLENGFVLKGNVSHVSHTAAEGEKGYYDYGQTIRRSLYIDDTLYTVSESIVKATNLQDMAEIRVVELA